MMKPPRRSLLHPTYDLLVENFANTDEPYYYNNN